MKKLDKIKNGLFKRNAALFKYAVKTGTTILKNRDDPKKLLSDLIGKDVEKFVDDLSHYKGSITKAGQLLSQYGEYYFSDEVNQTLRALQGSTHFLDFDIIKEQIPAHVLEKLEIETHPLAAASIGQVHKAVDKETGEVYALKIQYKGIEKAIKGDLFFLKLFIKNIRVIPKGLDLEDVFDEIKTVLNGEMDYAREGRMLTNYADKIEDEFFHVPRYNKDYSSDTVICMEFVKGKHLSELDLAHCDQVKLNHLGEKLYEIFLREIFEFFLVQTDAHGGNYLVSDDLNQVVLLDFGACLEYDQEVLSFYQRFLITCYHEDREGFFVSFKEFQNYVNKFIDFDEDIFWQYMHVATSPIRSRDVDWGSTDLPDQLYELGQKLRATIKAKSIPSEFIFLDRKVLGVFGLLKKLGARFDVQSVFERIALKENNDN